MCKRGVNMVPKQIKNILTKKIKRIKKVNDRYLYVFGPVRLPIELNQGTHTFQWYSYLTTEVDVPAEEFIDRIPDLQAADWQHSSILTYGEFHQSENPKVRLHSICHTGDIFGSQRCDCGSQLKSAFESIVAHGSGAVCYIANHEGRGIGLFSKTMAYELQDNGYDTVEANIALGYPAELRSFEEVSAVLTWLRNKPITLLSNNPIKAKQLTKYAVQVQGVEPLFGQVNEHNERYLTVKMNQMDHQLTPLEKLKVGTHHD